MKKNIKKILIISVVVLSSVSFLCLAYVKAESVGQQSSVQVDYQGQSPLDSDLDGLTDQGEIQKYKTDPRKPDTDSDGYYDGVEILAGTDPLAASSIPGLPLVVQDVQNEIPWPWYVSRMSALVGFALLYLSIFLGLTVRIPLMRKLFAPLYTMQAHCWIALQATIFALIHGGSLLFDKFLQFNFGDVFIPFASSYKPVLVGMGTLGFYLMVILTVSSYGRKYISQKLWRTLHFTNIFLYVFVIVHAYLLGTDVKNEIIRNIFIYANAFLILLMFVNMFSRIRENIARKNSITPSV